jgi:hypothetical protein
MPETKKTAKRSGTAKVQGAVAPKMRKATRQEKITKPAVYEVPVAQNPETKPKIGRPTIFKQEIADIICIMLSEGMSLRQILKADTQGKLPAQSTIYEWLIRFPLFAEQYARAREEQADTNADEILEIADEMPPEYTDKDGRTYLDQTFIAWQKNRIEARKWTAMKLKPKKYGDKLELGGDPNNPLKFEVKIEAEQNLAELVKHAELKRQAANAE